jgi:four helix bundle protein
MFPFEDLKVYNKAFLANQITYRLLRTDNKIPQFVKTQFGKASLSIMLNIAEGSAKPSDRDRSNFFAIARGSTFECSSLVDFLHQEQEISPEISTQLKHLYEEISKMLFTMIKNLKNKGE